MELKRGDGYSVIRLIRMGRWKIKGSFFRSSRMFSSIVKGVVFRIWSTKISMRDLKDEIVGSRRGVGGAES